MNLKDILTKYGVPDPSIVGKLPRGGITLDFVGHAEITRILLEIDENWSWAPVAWTEQGRPAINEVNGMAVMWGTLTVLGQSRLGVGSARADKPDLDKELVGDFLRNASMRFGISLSLWSKSEWEESHTQVPKAPALVSQENIERFKAACTDANLNPNTVADKAGVSLDGLKDTDMDKLRNTFKKMKEQPKPLSNKEAEQAIIEAFNATPVEPVHTPNIKPKDPDSKATQAQIGKLKSLMMAKNFATPEQKLELASDHCKRPITDLSQMKKGEISELIDILDPR